MKKLVSIHAAPIPSYFKAIQPYLPQNPHCSLLMIAESCCNPFEDLVREYGGKITYLQTFFLTLEQVEQMYHYFGEKVMIHL